MRLTATKPQSKCWWPSRRTPLTGLERELADLVKMNMDERIRVTEEYEQRLAQEVDEAKEQQWRVAPNIAAGAMDRFIRRGRMTRDDMEDSEECLGE